MEYVFYCSILMTIICIRMHVSYLTISVDFFFLPVHLASPHGQIKLPVEKQIK